MAAVLFYLSRNNTAYERLASEIRSTFSFAESIRRGQKLASCRYLRASIDEAMRLAPAAPGALWREACKGGAMVDGIHIPMGYEAGVCTYAIHHNPLCFPDPFVFNPDRFLAESTDGFPWASKSAAPSAVGTPTLTPGPSMPGTPSLEPHLVPSLQYSPIPTLTLMPPTSNISSPLTPLSASTIISNGAFAPFSLGPRSCLAKPLAYLELSLALARIMWLMEFEAVDSTGEGGEGRGRGRERKEEFQVVDMFSSNKDGPVLRFRERKMTMGQGFSFSCLG